MPRTPMTDEERAAKKQARAEAAKAKRETRKAELRVEIEKLASKLPPHIVQGGVQTVRAWKDSLDAATAKTTLSRVSVDRLSDALDNLRLHVEA
ncbi:MULTISPECIES: hypothetical protein [unclassified Paraburkholderia]|uniref:hypothetical protein n=1 Tax=unclassified Paraburkholderia TaxID=2615204 RepID=UPI00160D527D|nr:MULTISPECIES: hypothetical protein [unclassified Paraburkholderia]MBB5444612.1 hypothetical protein [Paraburkholderia sp. WSM4177]MBB5485436.1 hypothetical protein [Paraburkholderia sp. WSM4180]